MSDEFATFRAPYPSVSAALAACTRADWLVLLAWEALDHRLAVRIGSSAAQLLGRAGGASWLFKPNPDPLEAVAVWAQDEDDALGSGFFRAVTLAAFPAAGLAYFVEYFFVQGPWTVGRSLLYFVLIGVFEGVFASLVRLVLAGIVRRRAAQLDEQTALEIVLAEIQRGSADNPQLVPIVLKSVGGRVRRAVDALVRA